MFSKAALAIAAMSVTGLGAGLAVGSASGATTPTAQAAPRTPVGYLACPADGASGETALGQLHRGDRIYLTGRSADERWLQLRDPRNLRQRVWMEARWIVAEGEARALPVTACDPSQTGATDEPAAVAPEAGQPGEVSPPEPSPPASDPSGPSSPSGPSGPSVPGAPPTVPPDSTPPSPAPGLPQPDPRAGATPPSLPGNAAPTVTTPPAGEPAPPRLDGVASSRADIWEHYDAGDHLCRDQDQTVVSATYRTPAGLRSSTLRWEYEGHTGQVTAPVVGDGQSGTARVTVGPFSAHDFPIDINDRSVHLTLTVEDQRGRTATATTSVRLHDAGECIG